MTELLHETMEKVDKVVSALAKDINGRAGAGFAKLCGQEIQSTWRCIVLDVLTEGGLSGSDITRTIEDYDKSKKEIVHARLVDAVDMYLMAHNDKNFKDTGEMAEKRAALQKAYNDYKEYYE